MVVAEDKSRPRSLIQTDFADVVMLLVEVEGVR